jgi:hypothetical protein
VGETRRTGGDTFIPREQACVNTRVQKHITTAEAVVMWLESLAVETAYSRGKPFRIGVVPLQ